MSFAQPDYTRNELENIQKLHDEAMKEYRQEQYDKAREMLRV